MFLYFIFIIKFTKKKKIDNSKLFCCRDPTPKIDNVITTTWEPIAETGLAYLFIDDKMSMKYEMYGDRMKLFKELYEKYYEP